MSKNWDSVEYAEEYQDNDYLIWEGGEEGTENESNYLYKRKIDKEQKRLS